MDIITKELLLKKLAELRVDNNEALESETTLDEVYEQEIAIRDTFDIVEAMVKELPDAPKIDYTTPRTTAEQCVAYMLQKPADEKMIALLWGEYDVRSVNIDENGVSEVDDEFTGTPLTDEQVSDVLGLMEKNHDCNYGISWDTISEYVYMVKGQ